MGIIMLSRQIITSNLPSIVQAHILLKQTAYLWPSFAAVGCLGLCKKLTGEVNIWSRNLKGEDLNVNDNLIQMSGLSAEEFEGLTYERSGIDPHLVLFRKHTDKLVLEAKKPMLFTEPSNLGMFDTLTMPLLENDGTIKGTVHIAMQHCQKQD